MKWRALLIGGVLGATLTPGARADVQLAAPVGSLPGLRPAAASVRAARHDLADGLPRSLRALVARAQVQSATGSARGLHVRSDAFVLASGSVARQLLAVWRRVHRAGPADVGSAGYIVAGRGAAELAWRDGARIGLIALAAREPPPALRAATLRFALLADRYLRRPLPRTAWDKILAQIGPTGAVSRQTALQAFALAYTPLPGVRPPSGSKSDMTDLTPVNSWILSYLPELTPGQQRIVRRVLGVRSYRVRSRRRGARAAFTDDPTFTPTAWVQTLVDQWVKVYEEPQYLFIPMKLNIIAGITNQDITNEKGDVGLADATPFGPFSSYGSGTPTICRIRLSQAGLARTNPKIGAILAHETFHCFQFQILGADAWNKHPDWIMEGQAKWAEMAVDPTGGDNLHGKWLSEYLQNPETALFSRSYDAVGFWGHVEDSVPSLWKKIPAILAQVNDNAQAYAAAGGLAPAFLDSWGSSPLRDPAGGPPWQMVSPLAPSDEAINIEPIKGFGEPQVAKYTTFMFKVTADPGPLLYVNLSGNGRLSTQYNYTDLHGAVFCVDPNGCHCPPDTVDDLPPHIRPLDNGAKLGLTGGPEGSKAIIASASLKEFCKLKASPQQGGPGVDNGDPYMSTFDGGGYGFQVAGEFTLVKSRTDNLEIQSRQQPYPRTYPSWHNSLAMNTAFAMRDGGAIAEVDAGLPLTLYIDHRRRFPIAGQTIRLRGGGSILYGPNQVDVRWADGTRARVLSIGDEGVNVVVKLARDRAGLVRGLLGNDDGNAADDYVGRDGRRYDPTRIEAVGLFSHSLSDIRTQLGPFGRSWRITQAESLFVYPRGKSTRSYLVRGFPRVYMSLARLTRRERSRAAAICRRAGVSNRRLLPGCEIDVGATGNPTLASSTATVQRRAGLPRTAPPAPFTVSPVPWTLLSSPIDKGGATVVPSIATGAGGTVVAYRRDADQSVQTVTFTPNRDGIHQLSRRTPFSGWQSIDNPVLLPQADLIAGGIHSGNSGDSLNGTLLDRRHPDGSYGPPAPLTPSLNDPPLSAEYASDGTTPIWTSAGLGYALLVFHGGTEHDLTSSSPATPDSAAVLGRAAGGRLWVAWYGFGGGANGLYMMQLNPATGEAAGPALKAPDSDLGPQFGYIPALACAATCRLVWDTGSAIQSWAPGEHAPTVVFEDLLAGHPQAPGSIVASYTCCGSLWIAWFDTESRREYATLGDARGAGGGIVQLPTVPGFDDAGAAAATTAGDLLVLTGEWANGSTGRTAVWATVASSQ